MKNFWKDFKAFISRGNILDMAVGVIMGSAFGAIVTSLVNDIIMPLVALAMGGTSMSELCVVRNGEPQLLEDGTENAAALILPYGNFIQSIIDFLIIAICVFVFIRIMMRASKLGKEAAEKLKNLKKEETAAPAEAVAEAAPAPAAAPAGEETEKLLAEIRDLLKAREEKEPPKAE